MTYAKKKKFPCPRELSVYDGRNETLGDVYVLETTGN